MDRSSQDDKKVAEKQSREVNDVKDISNAYQLPMATIQDDDERLLARIGYRQELRREFTKWSTVSYAISILGVLGSQPATYGVPLALGGPATAVWAWFIGSFMAYVIASSGQLYYSYLTDHAMITMCSGRAGLSLSHRRWNVLRN